jgi:hypothetical protein
MAEDKQAERGGKQAERGGKQAERGGKQAERGGPNAVTQDIFRRISDLGGLLIVTFVASVPAAAGNSGAESHSLDSALEALASEAKARNTELLQSFIGAEQKVNKASKTKK